MKQIFGNVLLNFLSAFLFVHEGFWLSLKVAQCQNLTTRDHMPYCYGTSSRNNIICFTTLLTNKSHPVRKPYKETNRRCKAGVPGSSLIVIDSQESQRAVQSYIMRQSLENETIITDARMLSETESQIWSWVNGQPYSSVVSKDVIKTPEQFHDAACVELDHEVHDRQLLSYCFENSSLKCRYICEYPGFSYDDNRRYSAFNGPDTWYDARKNCLRSWGDLISLTDNRTIKKLPWLRENQKYWIGLHRNKWIWNSTGAALNYTNWNNGFPDESSDKQCICFHPQCRTENGRSICEVQDDRKWNTCNCNNSYAIVCQSEKNRSRPTSRFTTPVTTSINRSTTQTGVATSTSTSPRKPGIPLTTDGTTSSHDTTKISNRQTTALTSPMTQESSNNSFEHKPTEITTHSADGVSNEVVGLNTTGILLIVLLFVAVVIIIVAVILFIRKRKHGRRNERSPVKNTPQDEAVSSVYATVVSVNRPSDDTVPAGNTTYAELDMIQQPVPSSNTIYASVQPTTETIDMGGNVVYAELDIK